MHNLFGRLNFSAFAPRYCAARQGYPHEFSTIKPRFPQSYPQERELSSISVIKTAVKSGKLRNLAVYRLVYVWISLWIMWKTLLTVSENPANIPNFARFWQGFPQFPHSSPQNNPQKVNRLSTREGGIRNYFSRLNRGGRCTFTYSLLNTNPQLKNILLLFPLCGTFF